MDNFYPDKYQKSIYSINYKKLKKNGIKCILFDLNNTLVSYECDYPDDKLREFIYNLGKDFKIIIVSNSPKNRIRPFKEILNVDASFSSKKPFSKKFKKIMKLYNFKDTEIVMIGDRIITDIYGGNKMNFTTILVNSVSESEPFLNRIVRHFDRSIIKRFNKRGLLIKGEYYE